MKQAIIVTLTLFFASSLFAQITTSPNGNVGIGVTAPEFKLDINGSALVKAGHALHFRDPNDVEKLNFSAGTANSFITAPQGGMIFTSMNGGMFFDANADITFRQFVNGNIVPVLYANASTYRVGIGTTTPSAKLNVVDNGPNFALTNTGNGLGTLEVAMSYCTGCYSGQAQPGDGVVRVLGNGNLILNIPGTTSTDPRKIIFSRDDAKLMAVNANGSVAIGNVNQPDGYKLYVESGILTEKVKVSLKNTSDWSDYVFDKQYKLMALKDVEKYILENKHLPNVASAAQVQENGIDVAKMDAKLLEKIEELTLYVISMNKRIEQLEQVKNK